jgi:hypothetical protein
VFFEYHRGGGGGGMAAESFSYSPSQQVFLVMIADFQPLWTSMLSVMLFCHKNIFLPNKELVKEASSYFLIFIILFLSVT